MLADFYVPRLSNDMISYDRIEKSHLFQILYRSLVPVKKQRHYIFRNREIEA